MNIVKKVPEKMLSTKEIRINLLKEIFPEVIKEGKINFEILKEELGEFIDKKEERYEFTWSGKQEAKKIFQKRVYDRTLKYIETDSKNAELTENLYIEGDNLEVLKLIYQNYLGNIEVIYIDPPYNTGKDFIYKDNFNLDSLSSNKKEGFIDGKGNRLEQNNKSSNKYHANWLSMMYSRLKIARDFLSDKGIMVISIDDNEVENLKKICNELFYEDNYIGLLPRITKKSGKSTNTIAKNHDFLLLYAKNIKLINNFIEIQNQEGYKFKDEYYEERGFYKLNQTLDYDTLGYVYSLDYPIKIENEIFYAGDVSEEEFKLRKENNPKDGYRWRWSEELFNFGLQKGFIVVKKNKKGKRLYTKTYEKVKIEKIDGKYEILEIERNQSPSSLKFIDNVYSNDNAKKEIDKILKKGIFDYVKPSILIKDILKMIGNQDGIIMDFFSGSATTAHAVMQLNAEDRGNRKFIMVQVPEEVDEKTEAYNFLKVNNKPTNICEIGKERIRRAGELIKREIEENNRQLNLGEEPKKIPDIGFKVFKAADTSINWKKIKEVSKDNVMKFDDPDMLDFTLGFNDKDIVYEVLLRQRDLPLSEKLVKLTDIGDRTYLYADSYLICLETKITRELVECLAELNPLPVKFVFRDSAFGSQIGLKEETFRYLKTLIEKNLGITKKSYTVEFI
ncbi:site-specific DNA-methyltransferase [uncultured Fusobacterium sp.]|uniref:site-specific DNA-methyltransferase n=1 Tax=uncultured Fusobacterium sp. TaxID=159267 RepID=UPI0028044F12|nr:site-specific DNA-methyltransferase [uncultured Fusobacterium sp.]